MTTAAVERLAARLVGLEKQVRGLSLPQLGHSTIEGGEIGVVDDDGNPIGTIGPLPDGSGGGFNPINGQPPPRPSAPILTKVSGGLKVEWDGTFADDAIVPLNFSRVEVHVGDASGFYTGSALWLRGTIESPRGGSVVVVPLAKEPKFAVLVARSTSGLASVASVEVSAVPGGFFTDEDQARIDADLAEHDAAIINLDAELTTAQTDLANHTTQISALQTDLAAANTELDQVGATANGKGKVWYQTTPPAASSNFDIWFDTDNNNLPHQWNGSAWVAQPLGNAAIGNLDAAKISFGQMHGDRIAVNTLYGDRIIANTLQGDRIVANSMNADRIVAGSITTDRMTANNINGDRIAANTLHATKIVGKTITADQIYANSITSASGVIGSLSADHITAGTIAADRLTAASLTGRTITGGVLQTATSGNRITISGGSANRVEWTASDRNGHIRLDGSGVDYSMWIVGPWDNLGGEWIKMRSAPSEIVMGTYGNQGGGGDALRIRYDNNVGVQMTEVIAGRLYVTSDGIWTGGTRMLGTASGGVFFYSGSNTRVGTPGALYVQDLGGSVYKTVYASAFSVQSSGAVKRDIGPAPSALETIRRLRPVTYHRKDDPKGPLRRGLIAEEVRDVESALTTAMAAMTPDDPQGDTLGLDLAAMLSLALQGIAELDARMPARA